MKMPIRNCNAKLLHDPKGKKTGKAISCRKSEIPSDEKYLNVFFMTPL